MVNPIPTNIKNIWDSWNVRGLILFSLSLQITLILFAPLRKGFRSKLIKFLIWSAYLLADWAANFGVGLIADRARDNPYPSKNNELLAFWAPFMLIHLGGPDSITAFALADNELWLRHLLGLIFQAVGAVYVFLLSLPGNKMSIPTVLVFIAGTIKYSERIRALYLASAEKFQTSTREEKEAMGLDDYDIKTQSDWDDFRVAYVHFEASKSLFVDLSFGTVQNYYHTSQPFGFRPEDALRKIEIELNLIYQVFHTKTQVIHSVLGIILRFICFGSVVAALSIFYFQIEKHGYNNFDVGVTYTLLLGAIALDVIAFFMFVFSDETFVALSNYNNNSRHGKIKNRIAAILRWFLVLKSSRWQTCTCHSHNNHQVLVTPLLFPRWSGAVSGFDYSISPCVCPSRVHKVRCSCLVLQLIDRLILIMAISICYFILFMLVAICYFIQFMAKAIHRCIPNQRLQFDIGDIMEPLVPFDIVEGIVTEKSLSHEPLTKELWEFLFNEIERKRGSETDKLGRWMTRFSDSGKFILEELNRSDINKIMEDSLDNLEFWHFATEFLYEKTSGEAYNPKREVSKMLSDYMMYLNESKPTMINLWKLHSERKRQEKRIFSKPTMINLWKLHSKRKWQEYRIFSKRDNSERHSNWDDKLWELVEKLEEMENKDEMWDLVGKVWVELLSYGAIHCSGREHVQQLCDGGELLTFVWLLIYYFKMLR